MRIAVVAPRTSYHGGNGDSARLNRLVGGFLDAEHEIAVFTPRWWNQHRTTYYPTRGTHIAIGADRIQPGPTLRQLIKYAPDAIHALQTRPSVTVAAGIAASVAGASLTYDCRSFHPPIVRDSPAGKLATAVIDRLVVPSETVATAIRDSNLQANPVIIDDPIDIEAIKNVAVGDRADIVWTGEDTDTANLEPFLLGLAELRSNEFRAVILTPSSETDAMREAIDQLSLENHVEIIAQPTVRERLAIYRGAKVFVQTAAVCPYPSELVVAMAAGCRAIVQYHERSSAHEIVDRHGRGVFISTPEELADAIRQIARHTLRSRNDSFDRYSTTAVCQRLLQTYDNETDTRQ